MAENETLDICKSTRWVAVIRSIRGGAPSPEVERHIREALAKSWQVIRKQFRRSGFNLPELFNAASEGDAAFLEKAYRDSKYHRFVRLIGGCKGFMDGPADVLERAVKSQLRIVQNQIRDLLVRRGDCSTFAEADARVAGPFEDVAPDAAAFARRLVEAPVRAAKLLADPQTPDIPAASIINLSLINPAAPPMGIGR